MPGGACEATAFSAYGFESTCLCLPLGNYHNMRDIDGVLKGTSKAHVGQEFISIGDFESLIAMLQLAAHTLQDNDGGTGIAIPVLDTLYAKRKFVLARVQPKLVARTRR
jgi:endoglucanase